MRMAWSLSCPGKGIRIGNGLVSILPYDVFFQLEALALLLFSTAILSGLFFGTGLINKLNQFIRLDFVFRTDSFRHLATSISLEGEEKRTSPRNSILLRHAMEAYIK